MSQAAIYRRLSSGEWLRVYECVFRAANVPVTWHQRLLAACLRRPGLVWASHRSAAALWRLDDCAPNILEITTTCHLRGFDGLIVHQVRDMPPVDVTSIGVIPVTAIARTLMDLGAVLLPDEVEVAFESALRNWPRVLDRLQARVEGADFRGRQGVGTLRKILELHEGRPTESALETRFVQLLRRHRLPKPDRQHTVRDGGLVARVDFFYEDRRVAIEVDGRTHHVRRAQWEADLRRRNALSSRGILVLHLTHERMSTDGEGIAAEIRRALRCPCG